MNQHIYKKMLISVHIKFMTNQLYIDHSIVYRFRIYSNTIVYRLKLLLIINNNINNIN